jgi:crossover junction endodeoxyribonuclease RuvC
MIVLGFDPGTASTGWGVIEQEGNRLRSLGHGCIVTSAKDPTHVRLRQIHDQARGLIKRFKPDIVVLEELFVNANAKTALAVGQAKGVLILAACDLEAAPCEYSPLQIKLAVTGYGRASKLQVQEMTKVILGLGRIPQPDHAADALAVAITHTHHNADAYTAAVGKAGARRSPGAFKVPPGAEPVPAAVLRKAGRGSRATRDDAL